MVIGSCAGGKDLLFEENPPFSIKEASSQDWVSGVQGGGSGTNVTVYMGEIHEDIKIKDVYYLGDVAKAERHPRDIDKYVARFSKAHNRDIIMDKDPINEANNTVPIKSPFSLEKNEIVISYMHDGEVKYYKFNAVKEKPII